MDESEKPIDMNDWYENFRQITAESNKIFAQFFLDSLDVAKAPANPDPMNMNATFAKAFEQLGKEPEVVNAAGLELFSKLSEAWSGKPPSPHVDRRFADESWQEQPYFRAIKDSYLAYADWLMQLTENVDGLEEREQDKLEFYVKQFLDALSPSNYAMTNPQVLRATIESNGKNLAQGMKNLAQDFAAGKIGQTDMSAFELGKNLAATKGSVVFENELLQLIQYAPTTEKVHQTPLLFIPAWINRFYIADLQEKNSLVKWLLDQGYTVFLISWVNPTQEHSELGFEDYVTKGLLAAVDEVLRVTGEKKVNCMGYCLGGTLLATALAYLRGKKQSKIGSATFLTTMLDFSDAGELSVFVDEEQVEALEKRMSERGYLEGSEMAMTFSMLRSNDLIWSFVVNNYLLGKTPFPFDILYWNSDSTRMPMKMHSYYLRNMYLRNLLVKKNALEIDGVKIDVASIKNPAYFLSTKKDHIAPWESTFVGAKLFENAKFTLADSGHVAGVVNPPAKGGKPAKYNHWSSDAALAEADEWLEDAKEIAGSWWVSWDAWNKSFSGELVAARKPKNEIEPAPGGYVKG